MNTYKILYSYGSVRIIWGTIFVEADSVDEAIKKSELLERDYTIREVKLVNK